VEHKNERHTLMNTAVSFNMYTNYKTVKCNKYWKC